jgi:hypothetical protein
MGAAVATDPTAAVASDPAAAPPHEPPGGEPEALFEEARRRQRRRRAIATALTAAGIGVAASALAIDGHRPRTRSRGAREPRVAALPAGRTASLQVAGPLAVSPDGALYVADAARDRVLVRTRDGHFRVVAGNGRPGLAGAGGPAVDAELSAISDLAFTPAGSLDIADGGRVQQVAADGTLSTIAGTGRGDASPRIAPGTPALSASLGSARALAKSGVPLSIAIGPRGRLLISTGTQILRLAGGRLYPLPAVIRSGPLAGPLDHLRGDFGPIAVDDHGDVDLAGLNGWSVWQLAHGVVRRIGAGANWLARRSGGDYSILERAPGGAVYAENGATLLRIDGNRLVTSAAFSERLAGEYFWLTHFAFAPNGTVYADELPGGGAFEARQQLVALGGRGTRLLWEQPSGPPRRGGG